MMVAGFRGTLYRSYAFPPPLASHHECAMCEHAAVVGRTPPVYRGGSHPLPAHVTPTRQTTANLRAIGKTS